MKKIFYFSLLSLFMLVSSCSKEEQESVLNTVLPDKFTANIHDTTWSADVRKTTLTDNSIVLVGTSINASILEITIFGITPATYTLNTAIFDSAASAQTAALFKRSATTSITDVYVAKKGSVTITAVNYIQKTITGTFNFKAYKIRYSQQLIIDSLTISNGEFTDLKY